MNFDQLITSLRDLDGSLKGHVSRTANVGLTLRNWLVGAYIVEFEQNGEERAEYGTRLLPEIAQKLSIKGLNRSNLEFSRRLFVEYPRIPQTASGEFFNLLEISISEIQQTMSVEFRNDILQTLSALLPGSFVPQPIPQTLSGKSVSSNIGQTASGLSSRPGFALPIETIFQKLAFSHLVELLRIDEPLQRAFYEIECVKGGWSVRELKRQIGSLLFERLGLSTDKEKLLRLTAAEITPALPADIIKDPYIFEPLTL